MPQNRFTPRFVDLPVEIPIFPLSGAILMPDTQLPLNIFEPRHLAMVDDVLSTHPIIGMISLRIGMHEPKDAELRSH